MDLHSVSTESLLSEVGRRLFRSAPYPVGNVQIFLEMRNGDPCLVSKASSGYEQIEIRFLGAKIKGGKTRAVYMKNRLTQLEWVDMDDSGKT